MKILLKKSKLEENFILFGLQYQPENQFVQMVVIMLTKYWRLNFCHSWFLIIIKFMLKNIQFVSSYARYGDRMRDLNF